MAEQNPTRPDILDSLTQTQVTELDRQADEYDREQFGRIAESYGWTPEQTEDVWNWFEVQHKYPLDGVNPT